MVSRKFLKGSRPIWYISVYLLATLIITLAIHEGSHAISAALIGVPLDEIEFGIIGISPSVTIPERFANAPVWIVHYSGGLTAAAVLLSVYLVYWLRRYHRSPTFLKWGIALITIAFAALQLAQGYIEGRFHAAYIYDARAGSLINPLSWVLNIFITIFVILAVMLHLKLCPIKKMKKERINISLESH